MNYFLNFLNIHTPATPVPRSIKLLGSGTVVGGPTGGLAKLVEKANKIKAITEHMVTIVFFIVFSPPFQHYPFFLITIATRLCPLTKDAKLSVILNLFELPIQNMQI
jgi:hypothetical protein